MLPRVSRQNDQRTAGTAARIGEDLSVMKRTGVGAGWAIEWASAGRALDVVSGDLHVVNPYAGGALIATIDGLGHGAEARRAAQVVVDEVQEHPRLPLDSLVRGCHVAALTTRGVVMTVAAFDAPERTLSWAGIGNVEALLFRASRTAEPQRERLAPRGGVVGYVIPRVRLARLPVFDGDTLVMATDGLKSRFADAVDVHASPSENATRLLHEHARDADDALVLVVRFVEETRLATR